jgi:hypothetical protein
MRSLSAGPPHHRIILAVDVEDSTKRTNTAKADLRAEMYDVLERGLRLSGIADHHRDQLIDRGDGILALIHPVDSVPKTLMLSRVIPCLGELLAANAAAEPDRQIRMRAVVHAGEVHYDLRGCFGEALDLAFRLLDAPNTKQALKRSSGPLLLVVSDLIYQSIVRHGYSGIDKDAFVHIGHVQVGGERHGGWVLPPTDQPRGLKTVGEQDKTHRGGTVVNVATRRALRRGNRNHSPAPREEIG